MYSHRRISIVSHGLWSSFSGGVQAIADAVAFASSNNAKAIAAARAQDLQTAIATAISSSAVNVSSTGERIANALSWAPFLNMKWAISRTKPPRLLCWCVIDSWPIWRGRYLHIKGSAWAWELCWERGFQLLQGSFSQHCCIQSKPPFIWIWLIIRLHSLTVRCKRVVLAKHGKWRPSPASSGALTPWKGGNGRAIKSAENVRAVGAGGTAQANTQATATAVNQAIASAVANATTAVACG